MRNFDRKPYRRKRFAVLTPVGWVVVAMLVCGLAGLIIMLQAY